MTACTPSHPVPPPSDWVTRWSHLIAPGGSVLDVACGSGRHCLWLAQQGHAVVGIDRDISQGPSLPDTVTRVQADIENAPWPHLPGHPPGSFDAVVVTNYLWRPLFPTLLAQLAPGGVLIYETFAQGNAAYGKPSRDDFLLQPSELLQRCASLVVIAFEQGLLFHPTRVVQRIVAVRGAPKSVPARLERQAL